MTTKKEEISKELDRQHIDVQAAIEEAKASGDFSKVIQMLSETQKLVKAYGNAAIEEAEQLNQPLTLKF